MRCNRHVLPSLALVIITFPLIVSNIVESLGGYLVIEFRKLKRASAPLFILSDMSIVLSDFVFDRLFCLPTSLIRVDPT